MPYPMVAGQIQGPDLIGAYQRGVETRTSQLGNLLNQQKIKANQTAMDTQERVRAFQSANAPALMRGDQTALEGLAGVDYASGAEAQAMASKTQSERLKMASEKLGIAAQLANGVMASDNKDMALLRGKEMAKQAGLDPSGIPDRWGPEAEAALKQIIAASVSEKDRIDNELARMNADTARINAVTSRKNAEAYAERGGPVGKAPIGYRFTPEGDLEPIPGGPASRGTKQLPAQLQKIEQSDLEDIGVASSMGADIASIKAQLDTGALKLGPVENVASKAKNLAGLSDEQSRNFATFRATLEKIRNDSLRLNKGVQTEGDAVRAWNELLSNINDPNLVKQRLGEIENINQRAAQLKIAKVQTLRRNNNVEALPEEVLSQFTSVPAAVGASKGLAVGHEEDGFRFKGGDPGDPNSWEKI